MKMKTQTTNLPTLAQAVEDFWEAVAQWQNPKRSDGTPKRNHDLDTPPNLVWEKAEAVGDVCCAGKIEQYQHHKAAELIGSLLRAERAPGWFGDVQSRIESLANVNPPEEKCLEPLSLLLSQHENIPGGKTQLGKVIGCELVDASGRLVNANGRKILDEICNGDRRTLPDGWVDPIIFEQERLQAEDAAKYRKACELWPSRRRHYPKPDDQGKIATPLDTILAAK